MKTSRRSQRSPQEGVRRRNAACNVETKAKGRSFWTGPFCLGCDAELSGADLAEEFVDLGLQVIGLGGKGLDGVLDALSGGTGLLGRGGDLAHVGGDLGGALRRVMGRALDLLRRGGLLLDRGSD